MRERPPMWEMIGMMQILRDEGSVVLGEHGRFWARTDRADAEEEE